MIARATLILFSFIVPLRVGASAFEVYGHLVGKTLLIAPGLPNLTNFVTSDLSADKTNAIAKFEEQLANNGIAVVEDGPHFVRLLPAKQKDSLLKDVPLRGSQFQSSGEMLPSGTTDFHGVDASQVLFLYAELRQRTVLRPAILPHPLIQLKTLCPLSRGEVAYAFETVLALNGIAIVDDGDSFVQVVPMAQRAQVKAQAPKREPNAKLLDPRNVPAVGVPAAAVPGPATPPSKMELELERLQRAFYKFIHYKGPSPRSAFRLLELDAELTDRTAVSSKPLDGVSVWFQMETPLTKTELLYAIETTLKLSNLVIIPVDDRTIRLGRNSEPGKDAKKDDAKLHSP